MKHSAEYIQSLRMKDRTTPEEYWILHRSAIGNVELMPTTSCVKAETNDEAMGRVLTEIQEVFGRR